jgi:RecA/RadA recombinase
MSLSNQIWEIYGAIEPRRFMVLKFVERYLTGIRNRASREERLGLRWQQVWPDDVESEDLFIKVIDARVQPGTSYRVMNSHPHSGVLGRIDRPSEAEALLVEKLPTGPSVDVRPDMSIQNRQLAALRSWTHRPNEDRDQFFRLFESAHRANWPNFSPADVADWAFLTDDSRPGIERQREFVRKALATPDFALLEGPPGSGKTTVICEIIAQVVKAGGRVLLCAQTHEAVDNALERLMSDNTATLGYVTPVRVGRDVKRASEFAQQFCWQNLDKTVCNRLVRRLERIDKRTLSQDRILDALRGDRSEIGRLIVQSANVVCGTTSGAVGDSILAPSFRNAMPEFDILIVDEASKLTLQEFLVPALIARRWVLSGDPMQLPPFNDQDEIERHFRSLVNEAASYEDAEPYGAAANPALPTQAVSEDAAGDAISEMVGRLLEAFQLRFLPSIDRIHEDSALQRSFDAFSPELSEQMRKEARLVTGLNLRSVLESMIVTRGVEESLNEPRYAAAIDLGLPELARQHRTILLEIQQRMHPDISALVRGAVYQGRALIDPDGMAVARSWNYDDYPSHAVWKRVSREHVSSVDPSKMGKLGRFLSTFDRHRLQLMTAEAMVTAQELERFVAWADEPENQLRQFSVAIICFNRPGVPACNAAVGSVFPQHRVGTSRLGKRGNVVLRIGTVDSFQGREADLVFVNLGHWRSTSHLRSLNRVNVALTRARYQLVVVGRADVFYTEPDGLLLAELSRRLPYVETLR